MILVQQLPVHLVLHRHYGVGLWLLRAVVSDEMLRVCEDAGVLVFPAHLRDFCFRELRVSGCSHWGLQSLILLELLVSQCSHALYGYP